MTRLEGIELFDAAMRYALTLEEMAGLRGTPAWLEMLPDLNRRFNALKRIIDKESYRDAC